MARQEFRYDPPQRFVVGTVGEPGSRTFFLQARDDQRLTSIVCEKEQVAVLAERMDALLDEVVRRSGGSAPVPAIAPAEADDMAPLDQPIIEEFRAGTLTLTWDPDDEVVVVEAFAAGDDDADDADEQATDDPEHVPGVDEHRDVLIVRISGAMARSFVKRSLAVVRAGRPPCPLCQQPLDPHGHVCPRQNGYRRRG